MAKLLRHHIIPFTEVEAAIAASTIDEPQTRFNTQAHDLSEIKSALPNLLHQPPDAVQPLELLSPWLDLICASQHIETLHRIKLPRHYCERLVEAGSIWQFRDRISPALLEDLCDDFPQQTLEGQSTRTLCDGLTAYFVRLDSCSLKDAVTLSKPETVCGSSPVTHWQDVVKRIVTSRRGCGGIADLMAAGLDVFVFLLPWRADVAEAGVEFRVFCPPPGDRVAAISQYHWHRPLKSPPGLDLRHEDGLKRLYAASNEIHAKIMASPSFTDKLKRTGFTFDILVLNDDAQLLELNPFGAMSGCGSCLFHWINDAALLYGEEQEAELRISY